MEPLSKLQPHNPLLCDLQMVLSERNEALAEFKRLTDRAREEGNTAVERDFEKRGNFVRSK